MRQCSRCQGEYPDGFFRNDGNISGKYTCLKVKRYICIGCELTARTEDKRAYRSRAKAKDAYRNHGIKFLRRGIISDISELQSIYGWQFEQMAHDIEHAAENGCPYCRRPFSEMSHGLADLTLDIVDPSRPPYYNINTRWVCMTCNREKRGLSPEAWAEKMRGWELWESQQEKLGHDPFVGLPLFEGYFEDGVQLRMSL